MKNQGQANNLNNLTDPTVANDPQAQIEFDDLPISGEQEERVKGGVTRGPRDLLLGGQNRDVFIHDAGDTATLSRS